jgi:hypothetical protein
MLVDEHCPVILSICRQHRQKSRHGQRLHLCEDFPITYIQRGGLAAMMDCRQTDESGTFWTHPIPVELSNLHIAVNRDLPDWIHSPIVRDNIVRAIRRQEQP